MPDERAPRASRPVARQVSEPLVERLRTVLAAHGAGAGLNEAALSEALRGIAIEARDKGVRAEQLVASLKRVFDGLTPPPTLASVDQRSKRLAQLVTTCVKEYYSVPDAPTSGAADQGSSRS